MANVRILKQSFSGGEVSPEMFGRIEDAGYQNGAAMVRNFMVRPQGSLENRAGFAFVRAAKYADKAVRLIAFAYSPTQTLVIEFGHKYCRFHSQGGTVLDGSGDVYEIATPYEEAHLFDVHYVQSADVMTLVHPQYAPRELRRYGAADWRLQEIAFEPTLAPPANVKGQAHGGGGIETQYVVTSVDGNDESRASAAVKLTNNLYTTGNRNVLSWDKVAGAKRYKVYKKSGGLFGYIGQTEDTSLTDDNIAPDLAATPPIYDNVFASGGITEIPVENGGSGYTNKGAITKIRIQKGGGGYPFTGTYRTGQVFDAYSRALGRNAPHRWELTGDGTGAECEVTVLDSKVESVRLTNGGRGYSRAALECRYRGGHGDWQPVFRHPFSSGIFNSGGYAQFGFSFAGVPYVYLEVSGKPYPHVDLRPVVENGVVRRIEVVDGGRGFKDGEVRAEIRGGAGSGAVLGKPVLEGQDFPAAVSYFQQRRVFAGTVSKPLHVWMSKSGTESNMSYSIPSRADDRILFRIAAREAGMVSHIVPLSKLVLLSGGAEWNVNTLNSDALTPDSVSVSPQSYVGASQVQPIIVNNALVYAAARGGHVRELAYNWQAGGYITGDLSLRCAHLFDGREIRDLAQAKAPYPVVWAVSSDGSLLGCTYIPEQQIGAWHRHDTDGAFESCACVSEGADDILYCAVRRQIGGRTVRYIERMASRRFDAPEDAFFVDCGLSYNGAPTDTVSGLEHIEGKTVHILADGAVMPPQTVASGRVSLPHPAVKIHAGLPIAADMQTLPLAAPPDNAYAQGRQKNINKVWLRVYRSGGIWAGQAETELTEYKQRTVEPPGSPPRLKSEAVEITLRGQWSEDAQLFVRQIHPLPLTLLSVAAEVAVA